VKCNVVFRQGQAGSPGADVCVNMASREALFAEVSNRWQAGQGFTIATLNLDHMVKLQRSAGFLQAYSAHSHVVADGNPIVWLSRLAGAPVRLVPGSELVRPLAAMAARTNVPVALFGSHRAALEGAAKQLEAAYSGLQIVTRIAPDYGFDPDGDDAMKFIDQLRISGARLCFVALGAPKQEIFATRAAAVMPDCGFVSVGAGLDFIASTQSRAPVWVRRLTLEWLWRLSFDPLRLARRYWQCSLIFPPLAIAAIRQNGRGLTRGK